MRLISAGQRLLELHEINEAAVYHNSKNAGYLRSERSLGLNIRFFYLFLNTSCEGLCLVYANINALFCIILGYLQLIFKKKIKHIVEKSKFYIIFFNS